MLNWRKNNINNYKSIPRRVKETGEKLNIICGNFELTIQEVKSLKNEISELKSLEFTEEVPEKKAEKMDEYRF